GSTGTVNVTGAGSTWLSSLKIFNGGGGIGTVTIADGASASSAMEVGSSGPGTLNVRTGGSFTSGSLVIGAGSAGTMSVENGGTVNTPFAPTLIGTGSVS